MPAAICKQLQSIGQVLDSLRPLNAFHEKNRLLEDLPAVRRFLQNHAECREVIALLDEEEKFCFFCLVAMGQEKIFYGFRKEKIQKLRDMLYQLGTVNQFYDEIGGLLGYQQALLSLIKSRLAPKTEAGQEYRYTYPKGINIENHTPEVANAIRAALENAHLTAEIYPIGGAGDRLDLLNITTRESLPAAILPFFGKTLLEILIDDLEAKENLVFRLLGRQLITPVALMTSHEKNNHNWINEICRAAEWFDRPLTSFFLFTQPLVPMSGETGEWIVKNELELLLKPGGHGAIWKLAHDWKVFEWLEKKGVTKALIRQINNPISGIDYGLLAFLGFGFKNSKEFGFASCPRIIHKAEGMNVLREAEKNGTFEYCITNIEYTEFANKNVEDLPIEPGSVISRFPANSNILYADLAAIKRALKICSIPGMTVNLKTKVKVKDLQGGETEILAGRLESTMQNIADYITDTFPRPIEPEDIDKLKSYITYNERLKTFSVTKRQFSKEEGLAETPEGCYFDFMRVYKEFFERQCSFTIPELPTEEEYIANGPSFVIYLHPGLGPLFHIIAQKISKGSLARRSELFLAISELRMENVTVDGSLQILAKNIYGRDTQNSVFYSNKGGKCWLENVQVVNQGINFEARNNYWANKIARKETLKIIIEGNGEFYAKDVIFKGPYSIKVPDKVRVRAVMREGEVRFEEEAMDGPGWNWEGAFGKDDFIEYELKKY